MENAQELRVGIPRVLNTYVYAPLFNAYFESLGVQPENLIYSDYTSPELYRAGASRGAIDPCFPAKIGISHVYNLIQEKHRKKPLDVIFFPMVDVLHRRWLSLRDERVPYRDRDPGNREGRVHQRKRCLRRKQREVCRSGSQLADRKLFAHQMFTLFSRSWDCRRKKTTAPSRSGIRPLQEYETSMRKRARDVLDQLEREDRIGIVMLGRPYHHDPGLNHEILDEFQKLGYPDLLAKHAAAG